MTVSFTVQQFCSLTKSYQQNMFAVVLFVAPLSCHRRASGVSVACD